MQRVTLFAAIVVVVMAMARAQHSGKMTDPKPGDYKDLGLQCQRNEDDSAQKKNCRKMCGKPGKDGGDIPEYTQGEEIDVIVDYDVIFQKAHYSYYFSFKLCPLDDSGVLTQKCLDGNVLKIYGDGKATRKIQVGGDTVSESKTLKVRLPKRVTCEKCVLQWSFAFDLESCQKKADDCPNKKPEHTCAIIAIKPKSAGKGAGKGAGMEDGVVPDKGVDLGDGVVPGKGVGLGDGEGDGEGPGKGHGKGHAKGHAKGHGKGNAKGHGK